MVKGLQDEINSKKGNGRLINGSRSRRVSTARVPEAAAKEFEEKKKRLRQDSTVHKGKQGRNRGGERKGDGASQQIKEINGRLVLLLRRLRDGSRRKQTQARKGRGKEKQPPSHR